MIISARVLLVIISTQRCYCPGDYINTGVAGDYLNTALLLPRLLSQHGCCWWLSQHSSLAIAQDSTPVIISTRVLLVIISTQLSCCRRVRNGLHRRLGTGWMWEGRCPTPSIMQQIRFQVGSLKQNDFMTCEFSQFDLGRQCADGCVCKSVSTLREIEARLKSKSKHKPRIKDNSNNIINRSNSSYFYCKKLDRIDPIQ